MTPRDLQLNAKTDLVTQGGVITLGGVGKEVV